MAPPREAQRVSSVEQRHWPYRGVACPGLSVDPRDPLQLLTAAQFYKPELAALDYHAEILRTTDGGVTWQRVHDAGALIHTLRRRHSVPRAADAQRSADCSHQCDDAESSWTQVLDSPEFA